MNMTNEVRTAAYTLMQRHLTEPFANDEERRLVLRQADDACEILAAWLDAQVEAPEATERWEPAEQGFNWRVEDVAVMVMGNDRMLVSIAGHIRVVELPDDLRLFRCVEVMA